MKCGSQLYVLLVITQLLNPIICDTFTLKESWKTCYRIYEATVFATVLVENSWQLVR
jgi:hypothetical protein